MKLGFAIVCSVLVGLLIGCGVCSTGQCSVACDKQTPSEIRAQRIVIVDGEGRERIVMQGMSDGGGMWISGPDNGKLVGIYNLSGEGPVISLMNTKAKTGSPLALCLDKDGKPAIQIEGKDGYLKWIGVEQLEKLAKN